MSSNKCIEHYEHVLESIREMNKYLFHTIHNTYLSDK